MLVLIGSGIWSINPADPHRKQLWKAVSHLKRDCKPSYISMRDSCGRLVPLQDRAETIASYLEQKQWSNTSGQAPLPSLRKIGDDPDCDSAPFSIHELNDVLKGCKLGKQPGPDCIIMELCKWLNSANRQTLLNILNDWWAHGDIPTDLLQARVVPIYKKGGIDITVQFHCLIHYIKFMYR